MFSRIFGFDVVQHLFLMNVDQDPVLYRTPQPGTHDFARLKYGIAIGKNRNWTESVKMRDDFQCPWIETLGERVVDEKGRHAEQAWIVQPFEAITLQRPKKVRIPNLP